MFAWFWDVCVVTRAEPLNVREMYNMRPTVGSILSVLYGTAVVLCNVEFQAKKNIFVETEKAK